MCNMAQQYAITSPSSDTSNSVCYAIELTDVAKEIDVSAATAQVPCGTLYWVER
jgi:hypothetical protein